MKWGTVASAATRGTHSPTVVVVSSTTATTTRSLQPPEVANLLRSMGTAIVAELTALPEEVAAWHPAPGEWCAKECLGHILETERRGFNGRIRTILQHNEPFLPGWDRTGRRRPPRRDPCSRTE